MKRFLVLGCFAVFAAHSQSAVLIDGFTTAQSLTVTGTATLAINRVATGGSTIGTARTLAGINDANPFGLTAFAGIGSGMAVYSSGPRVDGRIEFAYGYDTAGGSVDMNLNLAAGGNNRLRLQFDSNDQDLTLRVFVRSTSGTAGSTLMAFSQTVLGGRPTTAFTEDVLFSSVLIAPLALSDVDQIHIQFDTAPAGDFSLTRMEAVPEPATMVALGLGAAALLRRRRA